MNNYSQLMNNLSQKEKELRDQLNSLKGQSSILNKQINESENKIEELQHNRVIYKKAVELMDLVQQATKERIKSGFEQIVTYALRYVMGEEYSFNLHFDRRGSLQTLDFNLQTPTLTEPYDPLDTSGGGVMNVMSVAVRFALAELTKPKVSNFICLDESFKELSADKLENTGNFLKEINKKIGRQIIMTSHREKLIETGEKKIEITGGHADDKKRIANKTRRKKKSVRSKS